MDDADTLGHRFFLLFTWMQRRQVEALGRRFEKKVEDAEKDRQDREERVRRMAEEERKMIDELRKMQFDQRLAYQDLEKALDGGNDLGEEEEVL